MGTFLILSIIVGIAGACGIFFVNRVGEEGVQAGKKLAPLADAMMEIKLNATHAHLILEEIMAGDKDENVQKVWMLFDESLWYANAILSGGQKENITILPTESPEIKKKIEKVIIQIKELIQSAKIRYSKFSSHQGVGTDADDIFDDLYEELQAQASTIMEKQPGLSPKDYRSLGMIKYHLANGHLYLAEILSGDEGESFEGVINDFKSSQNYTKKLISAGVKGLEGSIKKTDNLIKLAQSRYNKQKENNAAGSDADKAFDQAFHEFISEADGAEKIVNNAITEAVNKLESQESTALISVTIISLIGLILAIILGLGVGHSIVNTLTKIFSVLRKASDGDLDVRLTNVKKNDELADVSHAVNRILDRMEAFSRDASAALLYASRGEYFRTIKMEGMRGSFAVRANIINDGIKAMQDRTDEFANQVEYASKLGAEAVAKVNDADRTIENLSLATDQIGQVVNLIRNIAKQIDILAINARIEAESAGDAGKGFSAVAGEVKRLANQTAQATNEIVDLVNDIQSASQNVILVNKDIGSMIMSIDQAGTDIASSVEKSKTHHF